MFKQIICSIKGHRLVEAGSCPFTQKDYNVCTRCTKMVEANNG
jgi:hypothetical protein